MKEPKFDLEEKVTLEVLEKGGLVEREFIIDERLYDIDRDVYYYTVFREGENERQYSENCLLTLQKGGD